MEKDHRSQELTRVIHLAPPPGCAERLRITDVDWGQTTLGPLSNWQPSLRIAMNMMLQSPFPCALVWGSELTVIHNEDYSSLWPSGESGLGRCFDHLWRDQWQQMGPWAFKALGGHSNFIEDVPVHNGRPKGAGSAWHVFSYTPIHDDQGRVAGFLHKAIDTTASIERLQEWRELAQGFERRINLYMADHDLLWRLSRDAMIIVSRDLELLAANPAWFQILGWEVEEVRALPLLDLIHPSDRDEVFLAVGELLQGVEIRGRQSRLRHHEGHYCWINWSARLAGNELVAIGWEVTGALD